MHYFNINGCPSQQGKVAIITGANIGLGYETALALAMKEMTIVMACRDNEKAETARKKIMKHTPFSGIEVMSLDLSQRKSVEEFAQRFLNKYQRLDVLINNAGIMMPPYRLTEDGWESQMAVNYFGHFLLTSLLFEILDHTPGSRVISLSSIAHRRAKINFDDLNSVNKYSRFEAYAQSKLACLLFAKELDRQLKERGSSVLSLSAHPGLSLTHLGRHIPKVLYGLFYPWIYLLAQSAREGAEPILLAALGYPGNSKKIQGGDYFGPIGFQEWKGRAGKAKVFPHAQNPETARKLWEATEKLLNITFFKISSRLEQEHKE